MLRRSGQEEDAPSRRCRGAERVEQARSKLNRVTTALILGEVGKVARFQDRNHFASYTGTAPCDRGSAGEPRPSVNPHGNRRLNHAIHVVAVTQIRNDTPARRLYARKISEGKTKKEALRVVKRRVADAIFRQLTADAQRSEKVGPGGQAGTSLSSSVTSSTPTAGSSDRPQPGPKPKP